MAEVEELDKNVVSEEDEAAAKAAKEAAKEAKKAAKEAKKEAKRLAKENMSEDEKLGIGGKIIMFFVVLLIICIWLVIFAFLVKMDVGGFGSTVLFPVLKDVPYVNQILPGIEDYIPSEDEDQYQYSSIEEAVERIKELETEVETLKSETNSNSDYIAELETASAELAEYKANEAAFEEIKEKFYEEVVFSDNAPDIDEYKTYYESIEPENAEAIYKQVVSQLEVDEEIEDYVAAYTSMDAKNAAAIFDEMSDNFDLVCEILAAMDSSARADILADMDESNAAIITQMMEP